MSRLAHATYMASGFEIERRELDKTIRAETLEAKRIQRELGCTWAEAMRLARKPTDITNMIEYDKAAQRVQEVSQVAAELQEQDPSLTLAQALVQADLTVSELDDEE